MKTNSIPADRAVRARTITPARHLFFRPVCLWTGFLALAVIAFGSQPAQAAVTEAWVQLYGSKADAGSQNNAYAYKVVTDAAGNVIVAGSTDNQTGRGADMLVIKYSGAGVPLWETSYNGPADSEDVASALAVDASGNVFVTGYSFGSGSSFDYATIAYSGEGVPLWTNRYNGPGNESDQAIAVAVDASGNVLVTGYSGSAGDSDYATVAYSGAGVPLWTNRYNGPANGWDYASALAVDGSGNVFVTGSSKGSGGDYDYTTIAYSGAGVPLWTNRYNGPANGYDLASAVAVDASGNVFVTGSSRGSAGDSDYATLAYSGAGVPLWTNRYNAPDSGPDQASAVAVDGNGNVFVTGSSSGNAGDYATIAYSGPGVALWTNRYNGPRSGYDQATAMVVDVRGNVFVTGSSASGGWDYATIAYSGEGVPLWTNRYNGPGSGTDQAAAVAVDGSGNVFVTGSSDGREGDSDYATLAYSGAGVALWTKRYVGQQDASDTVRAVAMDASGNVFVTGISAGSGSSDYVTIAYSGGGVLLWTNRYHGPGDSYDVATAVAVDGRGNVFVTGYSAGSGGSDDYATIAYSGAGVPLWTNRYDGPENGGDQATAVAVDARGGVFVTGFSDGDYYTAKYAGADGSVLWQQRYNNGGGWGRAAAVAVDGGGHVFVTGYSAILGHDEYATIAYSGGGLPLWTNRYSGSANGSDQATAVAVDASGNVFVTGSSGDSSGNYDYVTIAYSGAGVPLWTNRFDGPENSWDQATAVAVDGSGNVFVTGSSRDSSGDYGYVTIAYSGEGVPLWTNRYNGPANGADLASAVAVDGSGNVVVTGRTDSIQDALIGAFWGGDYYTAKYAAADGATLWEKRFNGPLSLSFPSASPCLALGPNGMIAISGSFSGDFATVVYREVPAVSINLVPTGVRLRFSGLSGRTYNIERASAVVGPWSTINTQTAPVSGLLEYLDTTPHSGSGFYRLVQP